VEEQNIVGGFGSAVAEVMAEQNGKARLLRIGIEDMYSTLVGDQKYLRHQFQIDAVGIAEKVCKVLSI
jgi:transketolase